MTALSIVMGLAFIVTGAEAGGAGFGGRTAYIGPDGLSPDVLRIRARIDVPSWENTDASSHTVVFLNGRCAITIDPGRRATCSFPFWGSVGTYRYTVTSGGTPDRFEGSVVVIPLRRRVSMVARPARVYRGRPALLVGTVFAERTALTTAPNQPVTIYRRDRSGALRRIAQVVAIRSAATRGESFVWRLRVRPRQTTTYLARAVSKASVWKRAQSPPVAVRVR